MIGSSERPNSGAARRRRAAVLCVLGGAAAAAVAFAAAQALATPGSGAVSTYVARGPVSQSVVIGVPRTATATKTVRVRVGRKVVTRRVRFTYQTVTPLMTCGGSNACDTAYQQLTIPPGGYTGWHTHPGPVFIMVLEGTVTFYDSDDPDCKPIVVHAGETFLDTGEHAHIGRNETNQSARDLVVLFAPEGAAFRNDAPDPGHCPFSS